MLCTFVEHSSCCTNIAAIACASKRENSTTSEEIISISLLKIGLFLDFFFPFPGEAHQIVLGGMPYL